MTRHAKPAAKKLGGRPTIYSEEACNRICALLIEGHTLRQIGELDGLPSKRTIMDWLAKHEEFQHHYVRAREVQAYLGEDEIIEIADDGSRDFVERVVKGRKQTVFDKQNVERAKLRVEARKWLMAKRLPKRYGEKIDHSVSGELNLTSAMEQARERLRQYREKLQAEAKARLAAAKSPQ